MLPCNKRQKVVKRPSGLTLFRCMNNKCGLHGQEVDEQNCSSCPSRSVKHVRPCKKTEAAHDQAQTVTAQEFLDVTDKETQEMIVDAGFNVDEFDRARLFDAGEIPPNYPPLTLQVWTYKEALIKWNKAGRPKRTQEEVEQIHREHCAPCEWYDSEQQRCKGCGCRVTIGSVAVFNKLKMATEHCPKDKF